MNDRRIWFFLVAAAVSAALAPLAPGEFRWVPQVTAAAYVILAVLVAFDAAGRGRPRD